MYHSRRYGANGKGIRASQSFFPAFVGALVLPNIFIHIVACGYRDTMNVGDKFTTEKKVFAYGRGSRAIVVPAQLRLKPGEKIKVTFEKVEEDGKN